MTNLYFSFSNFLILFQIKLLKKLDGLNLIYFLCRPDMYVNIDSFYLYGA